MAQDRRRDIPYPKEVSLDNQSPFETSLGLGQRRVHSPDYAFRYDALPQTLELKASEAYANWLYELTLADPLKRTRGACIHPFGGLIFPRRPKFKRNTENRSYGLAEVEFPARSDLGNIVVAGTVHSHLVNGVGPIDVGLGLLDWSVNYEVGSGSEYRLQPDVHIVSGPRYNFMIVRTSDSLTLEPAQLREKIRSERDSLLYRGEREYAYESATDMLAARDGLIKEGEYMEFVLNAERKHLHGSTSFELISPLEQARKLAHEYKHGLYWSRKDGIYSRMSLEHLGELYSARMDAKYEAEEFRKEKGLL